jgi:hypothetical protein
VNKEKIEALRELANEAFSQLYSEINISEQLQYDVGNVPDWYTDLEKAEEVYIKALQRRIDSL